MASPEAERQRLLSAYGVLDASSDPALDDLVALAARTASAPVAYLAFPDSRRVWFKSRVGTAAAEIPLHLSACQYALQQSGLTRIADTAADPRFPSGSLPLEPGVACRSYLAAPLLASNGTPIGTLAVLSPAPNAFHPDHGRMLQTLARQAVTHLELAEQNRIHDLIVHGRQRIERALMSERNFVSAVLETVATLVVVLDADGRIVRFNRACEQTSGYRLQELAGTLFPHALFLPEDRERVQAFFDDARRGEPSAVELPWQTRNGSRRVIAWTGATLLDTHDDSGFVIATGIDVTAQREAEAAVRTSEARYRLLIEGSLGMICTHDLEGRLLSINIHAVRNLGYTMEELIGRPLIDLVPAEHREDYQRYQKAMAERGEDRGHMYLRRKNGRICVMAYRNKLISLPGEAPFVLAHGVDITEKTEAERELHALMRQRESILESIGDGIYGLDLDGRILFANQVGAAMLGYAADEVLGRDMHSLVHHSYPDGRPYPAAASPVLSSRSSTNPVRVVDEVFWRKDGAPVPVEYVSCPLVIDNRVTGIVVAFRDVSERRRLDRMKDEFISTVSHELRTPLTSLRASLGLIAGGMLQKQPDKLSQMLHVAIGNCERLVHLVNNILDFERIGNGHTPLQRTECAAETLLRRAADLQSGYAAHTGARFQIEAASFTLWVDEDRILQTLANLISNAIKFSPPGGLIHLSVRPFGFNEALFQVRDRGVGIPPEKTGMLFQRFQQVDASDSRSMGGTGLGLAICRSIVQLHGGRIWVDSVLGQGSTFSFTLPLTGPPPPPGEPSRDARPLHVEPLAVERPRSGS